MAAAASVVGAVFVRALFILGAYLWLVEQPHRTFSLACLNGTAQLGGSRPTFGRNLPKSSEA